MANSLILYIGQREDGQALAALAEQQDSYVYLPETLMQALGMYITYFPQIIVIDMALDYAGAALEHLRSVDAKPIFLLTDQPVRSAILHTLPQDIPAEALLDALAREPIGVLRYA